MCPFVLARFPRPSIRVSVGLLGGSFTLRALAHIHCLCASTKRCVIERIQGKRPFANTRAPSKRNATEANEQKTSTQTTKHRNQKPTESPKRNKQQQKRLKLLFSGALGTTATQGECLEIACVLSVCVYLSLSLCRPTVSVPCSGLFGCLSLLVVSL